MDTVNMRDRKVTFSLDAGHAEFFGESKLPEGPRAGFKSFILEGRKSKFHGTRNAYTFGRRRVYLAL
jgi:hypothetical protein